MSCIRSCYDKDSSNFGHDDCPTCIHKDATPQRKPLTKDEILAVGGVVAHGNVFFINIKQLNRLVGIKENT